MFSTIPVEALKQATEAVFDLSFAKDRKEVSKHGHSIIEYMKNNFEGSVDQRDAIAACYLVAMFLTEHFITSNYEKAPQDLKDAIAKELFAETVSKDRSDLQ